MISDQGVPDVVGYTLAEGRLILQKEGYRVDLKYTRYHSDQGSRIIRQVLREEGIIELVISNECYHDPATEK